MRSASEANDTAEIVSRLISLIPSSSNHFSPSVISTPSGVSLETLTLSPPFLLSTTDSLAKAIAALHREVEFYGRICISPYTWPVEAFSEFIPLPRQDALRGRAAPPPQAAQPGFVSIATLAASVEDAAVLELANLSTSLG